MILVRSELSVPPQTTRELHGLIAGRTTHLVLLATSEVNPRATAFWARHTLFVERVFAVVAVVMLMRAQRLGGHVNNPITAS